MVFSCQLSDVNVSCQMEILPKERDIFGYWMQRIDILWYTESAPYMVEYYGAFSHAHRKSMVQYSFSRVNLVDGDRGGRWDHSTLDRFKICMIS